MLSILDDCAAIFRGSVEVGVLHAFGIESVPDLRQERRELTEDQRPVTAVDHVVQLLCQCFDLRGRHTFVLFFDDQRLESFDIPQLRQRQLQAGRDAVAWLRRELARSGTA